jgi:hypothetical protein
MPLIHSLGATLTAYDDEKRGRALRAHGFYPHPKKDRVPLSPEDRQPERFRSPGRGPQRRLSYRHVFQRTP